MVSQSVINTFGAIGGVILAICQGPQLIKLYRSKSAKDLSYGYLALYSLGLFWICIYLYLENALVGFICECLEFACGIALIAAKYYLDNYGPHSAKAETKKKDDCVLEEAPS